MRPARPELLAEEVPDIVSAVVPVGQNYAVVAACAEAGVRVVSCEKPIHFSLAEADKLIALCEAKGTLFACAQCHYSSPQVSSCLNLVGGGVGHGRDGTSLPSRLQPYLTVARR